MCLTCGCHEPVNAHGKADAITIQDFRAAAAAFQQTADEAFQNFVDTYTRYVRDGQVEPESVEDAVKYAFVEGFARHASHLSVRARGTLEGLLDTVQRYDPLTDDEDEVDFKPVAAGICVQADDTERILLQQRDMSTKSGNVDNHGGEWEFPGGKLDDEDWHGADGHWEVAAWQGAVREWQEEIGIKLPFGHIVDIHTNKNGYVAFLYQIDSEDDVPINLPAPDEWKESDFRTIRDPDNPKADYQEVAAWWHLDDVRNSSAVRPEVRKHTPWKRWFGLKKESGPNTFDLIESAGEKEGLRTRLFMRRDRVWQKYDKAARTWSEKFALVVPVDRLVKSLQDVYGRLQEDTERRRKRDALALAAAALLWHTLSDDRVLHSELEQMAEAAMAEGAAEGTTTATAFTALDRGLELPDFDALKAQELSQLLQYQSYWAQAPEQVRQQIDGLAGDIADVALRALRSARFDPAKLEETVSQIIAKGDGVAFYLDQAISAAYAQAVLNYYERAGVQYLNWVTVGDDRVCVECEQNEDANPHPAEQFPPLPAHGACRCWAEAADQPGG